MKNESFVAPKFADIRANILFRMLLPNILFRMLLLIFPHNTFKWIIRK